MGYESRRRCDVCGDPSPWVPICGACEIDARAGVRHDADAARIAGSVAASAHLYLFATNTFLPAGLAVMDALGFRYVTNVVWTKEHFGIGQYFRGQHELCLFGVRGSGYEVRTDARDLSSIVRADHRRDERGQRVHSGKPDAFFDLVEARSKGPYLEMFARRAREGWDAWGNQAPEAA